MERKEKTQGFGAEAVATGHYARVEQDRATGRYLLQRWLDASKDPHPWDYLAFCFYLSHFFVTPCFALYIYLHGDRDRFQRYAMTILAVSLAAFATYLILPAAPPWLASEKIGLAGCFCQVSQSASPTAAHCSLGERLSWVPCTLVYKSMG